MFHGSWFLHKERGIRFPDDLPVAHIAVIGPIHFANALGFNHRSLEGFCGYYRAHANAMTLGDDPAQRGGIQVGIVKIRYTFLGLGFNGPSQFIAQGFVGIPHIGGFQRGGVRNFFFKFFRRHPSPMRFGQSEPIVFHIVTDSPFNAINAMHTTGYTADHIDPVNILHTGAHYGATVFFGHTVQPVGDGRGCGPRINRFFASRNDIDPAGYTFFKMGVHIVHKAEQGQNGNVSVAFIQHRVGVVSDGHAQFASKPGIIAHIHSDDFRVYINGADNFGSFFIQIPQQVFGHFAAPILYDADFFIIHHCLFLLVCSGLQENSCIHSIKLTEGIRSTSDFP